MSSPASVSSPVSSRAWKAWIVFLGAVLGVVGLNVLAIRGGAYVDGWPTFAILGGLGGGLLTRIIVGPANHGG